MERLCNVERLESVIISVALKTPLEITLGICIRHFCIDPMTLPALVSHQVVPHILQQNCAHVLSHKQSVHIFSPRTF